MVRDAEAIRYEFVSSDKNQNYTRLLHEYGMEIYTLAGADPLLFVKIALLANAEPSLLADPKFENGLSGRAQVTVPTMLSTLTFLYHNLLHLRRHLSCEIFSITYFCPLS